MGRVNCEDETSYLLKSETMKKRLLEAKKRQHLDWVWRGNLATPLGQTGISLEETCPKGFLKD